jgi:hypothetical protein
MAIDDGSDTDVAENTPCPGTNCMLFDGVCPMRPCNCGPGPSGIAMLLTEIPFVLANVVFDMRPTKRSKPPV